MEHGAAGRVARRMRKFCHIARPLSPLALYPRRDPFLRRRRSCKFTSSSFLPSSYVLNLAPCMPLSHLSPSCSTKSFRIGRAPSFKMWMEAGGWCGRALHSHIASRSSGRPAIRGLNTNGWICNRPLNHEPDRF